MSTTAMNPEVGFFISHTIFSAWEIYKKRLATLLGMFAAFIVANILIMILTGMLSSALKMPAIGQLVSSILSIIVSMGWIKIIMKITRDQSVSLQEYVDIAPYFVKYFLGVILYALIVVGGLILFIVPGIIWAIKYMYIPYLIIDKGVGPMEAMRMSGKITQGAKWDLVGFSLATAILVYLGILALLVGALITIPVAALAQMMVYNILVKRLNKAE